MNILLTGGTGFIASHTCVVLQEAGHNVALYDNFSNSTNEVFNQIERITGKRPSGLGLPQDVRDEDEVTRALEDFGAEAVIHFAGLKAVGESVREPLKYFDNNVLGTLILLKAMKRAGVHQLVFSSSATVYGDPQYLPLDENHITHALNPYGRTKLHIEEMLQDAVNASDGNAFKVANLRYFNPVGAHESGLIGENPNGIPNNLMPFIARVASGQLPQLEVFGSDYATIDGTGVRDYIHVMDLAHGHAKALDYLNKKEKTESIFETFNLGTGQGTSVLQMIKAFEDATEIVIPYQLGARRSGDTAACYASVEKAEKILGWRSRLNLTQMCASTWKFQKKLTGI